MEKGRVRIDQGSFIIEIFFRHVTLAGEYTIAGAQALYERDNELEKIRIPGPLKEPILIYVSYFT